MMRDVTGPDHSGDLGSILAVFAHPDDEAYLAGALMAKAVDEGRRVVCVTATRGELGFPDDDPRSEAERAALRTAEMADCLGILGVEEHHWLDLPDGAGEEVPDEVPVARIAELIDEIRPDTTLTFGPDGQTYHVDHIAICRWTTQAVAAAPAPDPPPLRRHDRGVDPALRRPRGRPGPGDDGSRRRAPDRGP